VRVPREEVPLPARVVHLAQVAVLSGQAGGAAAAVVAVRGRRGRALFPDLADVFCAAAGSSCPATATRAARARPQADPKSAANLPNIHGPSAPDWLSVTSR